MCRNSQSTESRSNQNRMDSEKRPSRPATGVRDAAPPARTHRGSSRGPTRPPAALRAVRSATASCRGGPAITSARPESLPFDWAGSRTFRHTVPLWPPARPTLERIRTRLGRVAADSLRRLGTVGAQRPHAAESRRGRRRRAGPLPISRRPARSTTENLDCSTARMSAAAAALWGPLPASPRLVRVLVRAAPSRGARR